MAKTNNSDSATAAKDAIGDKMDKGSSDAKADVNKRAI